MTTNIKAFRLNTTYPQYFYKYRGVTSSSLSADFALKALIDGRAYFSSRKVFNDLFDSKVELLRPSPRDVKSLSMAAPNKKKREELRNFVHRGKFTAEGSEMIAGLSQELNTLIDRYTFYCVSARSDSNLMWSHYADCHRGFCIEFKSSYIKADRVTYQKEVPQIEVIELLKAGAGIDVSKELGQKVWQALRTKLEEWSYEEEYRFQAGSGMENSVAMSSIPSYRYEPEWINSIIFGCRMPEATKKFIIERMPPDTKFKAAIEKTSTVAIVPYRQQ